MNKFMYNSLLKYVLGLLTIWYLLVFLFHYSWLIPYPHTILKTMFSLLVEKDFYYALFVTLQRVIYASFISILSSLLCAIFCYCNVGFQSFIRPFVQLLRSIPNISYILILLVFFGSEVGVITISFFITFPTTFISFYHAFEEIDTHLIYVMKMYPISLFKRIYKVYLPMLKLNLKANVLNTISLCLKVGVMAEIIGSVSIGVGREMYQCKLFFDMPGLFAWTFWIVILLILLENSIEFIYKKYFKD